MQRAFMRRWPKLNPAMLKYMQLWPAVNGPELTAERAAQRNRAFLQQSQGKHPGGFWHSANGLPA